MKKRKKHKREIRGFTGETAEEGNSNKKESISSWEKLLKKRTTLKWNEGLDGKACRGREQQNMIKTLLGKSDEEANKLKSNYTGVDPKHSNWVGREKLNFPAFLPGYGFRTILTGFTLAKPRPGSKKA